ncbi:MAG: hypothetical protein H6739_01065 [Alphaproteobacteria bacterium]|nr:hypothetical protein [Alphaproteobacteria bacterium]
MTMPTLTASNALTASRNAATFHGRPRSSMNVGVESESCSWGKAALCAGAAVACGATCVFGPEACVPCLTAIGAPICLSCLLG